MKIRSLDHAAVLVKDVANVRDGGEHTLALFLDQSRGLLEVLRPGQRVLVGVDVFAQVHRDDVGALRGEHPGVRTPLTACGSTDYGNLARHPAHRRRPSLRPSVCINDTH